MTENDRLDIEEYVQALVKRAFVSDHTDTDILYQNGEKVMSCNDVANIITAFWNAISDNPESENEFIAIILHNIIDAI